LASVFVWQSPYRENFLFFCRKNIIQEILHSSFVSRILKAKLNQLEAEKIFFYLSLFLFPLRTNLSLFSLSLYPFPHSLSLFLIVLTFSPLFISYSLSLLSTLSISFFFLKPENCLFFFVLWENTSRGENKSVINGRLNETLNQNNNNNTIKDVQNFHLL